MKSFDKEEILFSDNHILITLKPAGLLTQPDESGNPSIESFAKKWVKQKYHKPGDVFLHCIHRLDRPVSGLVLFARTSKSLKRLNEQSRNLEIQRVYEAEVEGILNEKIGRLDHYLIHGNHRAILGREGDLDAKHARLTYQVLHYMPDSTIVRIELETGRYHQIRAQFSAIGHPIKGDQKSGSSTGDGNEILLHCAKMSFAHPVTKEILTFESPAPFG
jgi:23S rRNA pseudouridine1911/1915/1917 synthase